MEARRSRHPISAIYGDFTRTEYLNLKDNIEDAGIREPIVIYEDKILDGWHRYRAGMELGMPVPEIFFEGSVQEAADLVRAKHTRRSISDEARALAIAELYRYCTMRIGRPRNSATVAEYLTIPKMAADAGVSTRTMHRAREVAAGASETVRAAVKKGELKIATAARISRLPSEEQEHALEQQQQSVARKRKANTSANKAEKRNVSAPADSPKPLGGPGFEALEEMRENLAVLSERNDELEVRLAVHFMEGTEEEKAATAALIAELQKKVARVTAELETVKASRDSYMTEASELRRQCSRYRDVLRKLGACGKAPLSPVAGQRT